MERAILYLDDLQGCFPPGRISMEKIFLTTKENVFPCEKFQPEGNNLHKCRSVVRVVKVRTTATT